MTEDQQRIAETFGFLTLDVQSDLLTRAGSAACHSALARVVPDGRSADSLTHTAAAEIFLMRCVPNVPIGYMDDFGFQQRYLDQVMPMLQQRCVAIVFSPSAKDEHHAQELANEFLDCAMLVRQDFCAPDFSVDGFVSPGSVAAFLTAWRDKIGDALSSALA